jgi:hypothetical protein
MTVTVVRVIIACWIGLNAGLIPVIRSCQEFDAWRYRRRHNARALR